MFSEHIVNWTGASLEVLMDSLMGSQGNLSMQG